MHKMNFTLKAVFCALCAFLWLLLCLCGSVLDAEGAHAAIEVAAVHAHQFRGARDVAVGFFELSLNELAMVGLGGFFKGRKAERRRGWFFLALRRQIGRPKLSCPDA